MTSSAPMSWSTVAEDTPPGSGASATGPGGGGAATTETVVVVTADRVDRICHDALRSHYKRHPDIPVVLVADIVAVAPFGVAAVVRTAELYDNPDLLQRVKALAAEGGHRLPPGLGSCIRTAAAEPTRQQTLGQPGTLLKPSEVDVLTLVAEGLTRTGIARRLGRTPEQVRSTLKSIFTRLGVHQLAEAVAYAARAGLLGVMSGESGERPALQARRSPAPREMRHSRNRSRPPTAPQATRSPSGRSAKRRTGPAAPPRSPGTEEQTRS